MTQQREGGLPVVTTGLRVPGGQIVHRTWCVAAGGGAVAVVDLENRSRDAVAVAVVLGAPPSHDLHFDGDRRIAAGGALALVAGRPVARVAVGSADDVRATVTAGAAGAATGPATGPAVGLVFPLAHTARLRLALPTGAATVDPAVIDTLPGSDAVAAGWRAHLDAGARVGLPDDRLSDAVAAARVRLLFGGAGSGTLLDAATVALALASWGHAEAAAAVLAAAGGPPVGRAETVTAATLLAAWAACTRGGTDVEREALVEPAARLAHRLARRSARRRLPAAAAAAAQLDAAELLDRAGQLDAAALCRARARGGHPLDDDAGPGLPNPPDPDTGDDPVAAARFLVGLRRLLADDTEPGCLRLLAPYPDAWLGQDLEVHRLPTRGGTLSYALRWHGPRPAVLWERVPLGRHRRGDADTTADAVEAVRLVAPALDPGWSTSDLAGEALLAPVEPAGGLPKVVAPLFGDGTPVDDVPGDGLSFS